jgi:hypothetical protein
VITSAAAIMVAVFIGFAGRPPASAAAGDDRQLIDA